MSSDVNGENFLTSISSISQGASIFFVGKVCYQVLVFITSIILTRVLGATNYGIYAYLRVLFSLFSVLTRLGGDKAVLRFIPEYESDPQMQGVMLTLAYLTSLLVGGLVAVGVYYLAPFISHFTIDEPLFVDVLRVGAIVLPFNTLANITYSTFKSIERMDYNVAVSSVVDPLLRLFFVGGAVLLGYSVVGAVAGLVVSGILAFVAASVALVTRTDLNLVGRPSLADSRKYYDFSIPIIFNQIGNFLYNRVDILMVGIFLSGTGVGIYNITVLIAGVLVLPLTAFNQLFPPIASRLYHNGNLNELENIYNTITRWTLTISLFPGLVMIIYSHELLNIFGEEFTQGSLVLILFVVAQLTNCAVGPSGLLLMMTDNHYLTMVNQLSSGVVNIFLNYILIIELGFIGAAVATTSVLISINLLRVFEVWYFEDMVPYDIRYYKPIMAGLISAVLMLLISLLLELYILIIFGGIIGAVAFVSVLYYLGLEPTERKLMNQILSSLLNN